MLKQDFFATWSSNMAYILGYFAADGCMVKNARGGCYIEFTSTDRILLEQVAVSTGSKNVISQRNVADDRWRPQYRLQIGSVHWFQNLLQLGFTPNKSNTLQLPSVPSRYFRDFVRGYFDGDGCVYFNILSYSGRKNPRHVLLTSFTSGSKTFLEKLLLRMREFGICGGYIRQKAHGYDLQFSHGDSLALYRLIYNNGKTTGLFLPRKYEHFQKGLVALYGEHILCGRSLAG